MSLERFRRTRMVILTRQSKVYQAARAMADSHIGSVLVSEPPGLAGIVTDRDLALAVIGGGLDPRTTPLDEVMSEDVVACEIKAELDDVVRLMQEHGVRRVPITEDGRVVGLITFDDLVVDGSVPPEALPRSLRRNWRWRRRTSPRACCIRRGPSAQNAKRQAAPAP